MKIDIASMQVDAPPRGFDEGLTGQGDPVCWRVVADASTLEGKVIAEISGDTADYRFPLCLYRDVIAKDVTVLVRFKAVAGEVDQAAGLIVRAVDHLNYYVTRANALEANVRLYRVINGVRRQIAGHNIDVPSEVWQSLCLEIVGDRLSVMFNDERVIEASDPTLTQGGKIGLWTKADSLTHFADLEIVSLPGQ
jgi:hypothetical protein